jgi:hypothetical protein
MKISICGSMAFAKDMLEIAKLSSLRKQGSRKIKINPWIPDFAGMTKTLKSLEKATLCFCEMAKISQNKPLTKVRKCAIILRSLHFNW